MRYRDRDSILYQLLLVSLPDIALAIKDSNTNIEKGLKTSPENSYAKMNDCIDLNKNKKTSLAQCYQQKPK